MNREGSCRLPKKRTETVTLLEKLKTRQKDSIQRACIDSICSLLTEKEMQMMALLQLVADTPDTEEIIHQAAAVSQKVRSKKWLPCPPIRRRKGISGVSSASGKRISLRPATRRRAEESGSCRRFRC